MTLVCWDRVPAEFHFLRAVIEACGDTRFMVYDKVAGRHIPFIETASASQLDLIRSTKAQMECRDDRHLIEQWCENPAQKRPSLRNTIWHIQGILFLFDQLDGHYPGVFDDET